MNHMNLTSIEEVDLVVKNSFLEYVLSPSGIKKHCKVEDDTDLHCSAGILASMVKPKSEPVELEAPRPWAQVESTPWLNYAPEPAMAVEEYSLDCMHWLPATYCPEQYPQQPPQLQAIPTQEQQQSFANNCCQMYEQWMYMNMAYMEQSSNCYAAMHQPAKAWEEASTVSGANSAEGSLDDYSGVDMRTTMMLRNLPTALTRDLLQTKLDEMGFYGHYDLVYLPVDFSTGTGLGYAFVNAATPRLWQLFVWEAFDGLSQWPVESEDEKVCTVSWSDPHQGLASHIERYQNSPVMHPDVPEEWKPALFMSGIRVPFPLPTKKIKAPKVRTKKTEAKIVEEAAALAAPTMIYQ
eukprot:CAMPEP_0206629850 /NCGR_PEP_ID=MMETSP0325_2-20121206/67256_1 /ASSEMBLY_ACC=CAM_ASM_000347 /TAXON_ID=2866 /ORGANISM="Crypthecodinium cohnii, Strain Seligo" /LENGTH=350 /DNA_ID=CAMNT_0054154663 /DNA_START=156 /DNA_END=1209 /DNA_ORIENTATION=-